MSQQTFYEWYNQQMVNKQERERMIYQLNTRQKPLDNSQINELFEQAKEMEKMQMEKAFRDGYKLVDYELTWDEVENYYKQTYNK